MSDIWKNKMPIGAWGSPCPGSVNGTDYINDENYQLAKDAGLRFLVTLYELGNVSDNERALTCAQNAGIGLYLNERTYYEGKVDEAEGRRKIAVYSKYPSFYGIAVKDEPGMADFKILCDIIARHKADLPEQATFYTNLMPIYATSNQLIKGCGFYEGEPDPAVYEEYLERFVKEIDVPMFSYDFYPFREEKGWIDEDYFKQLSLARRMAEKKGTPLWVFIQVTSWQVGKIRDMTYSEILWQVTTSLAMGAKGIQYFTYITPIDDNSEYFGDAMLNRNHKPTALYYFVQKVNRHLEIVGDEMLSWNYCGVMKKGNCIAPVPQEERLSSFGSFAVSGKNYLCGCFEKEGRKGIYLLNPSLTETNHLSVSMDLKAYSLISGDCEETVNEDCLHFVLAPGEAVWIAEK